jgi:hypothetical protein
MSKISELLLSKLYPDRVNSMNELMGNDKASAGEDRTNRRPETRKKKKHPKQFTKSFTNRSI